MQDRPLLRPELYRERVKPYHAKLFRPLTVAEAAAIGPVAFLRLMNHELAFSQNVPILTLARATNRNLLIQRGTTPRSQ